MAYVITAPCVGVKDASCVEVCPVDAIHPGPGDAGFAKVEQLYINPDECICCGVCEPECPVGAIYPDDDVPLEWVQYVARNADFFK